MLTISNQKGASLVEVTIAALIFSIAAAGLFATFTTQRRASDRAERRLQAAYYGRQIFDNFRAKVDQRNWGDLSSNLSVGTHTLPPSGPYTASYTVTEDPTTGVRKVNLTIQWNEP